MKRHSRSHRREYNKAVSLALGTLTSLILLTLFTCVGALILTKLKDPSGAVGICALICLVVGGAAAGAILPRLPFGGGMLITVLSALSAALIILIVSIIVTRGDMPIRIPTSLLCYMLASSAFSYLSERIFG